MTVSAQDAKIFNAVVGTHTVYVINFKRSWQTAPFSYAAPFALCFFKTRIVQHILAWCIHARLYSNEL